MSTIIYSEPIYSEGDKRVNLIDDLRRAIDVAKTGDRFVTIKFGGVEIEIDFTEDDISVIV